MWHLIVVWPKKKAFLKQNQNHLNCISLLLKVGISKLLLYYSHLYIHHRSIPCMDLILNSDSSISINSRWFSKFQPSDQTKLLLRKSNLLLVNPKLDLILSTVNPKLDLILSTILDYNLFSKETVNQLQWEYNIYVKMKKVPKTWLRKIFWLSTSYKHCIDVIE